MPVTLVPQTPPSPVDKIRRRIKANLPASMLQCRCGSRELIEAKTGVLYKDGRCQGGTKVLLCLSCLTNGKREVVA